MAAALTALLFATFTYGIYFGVIVKTYALLSFLFTLTFLILSLRLTDSVKYPLAVVVALSAAMVRLSAIAFAAVIIAYCLIRARRHVRYIILALSGIIIVLTLSLTIPNSQTIEWNLLGHHLGQWGELSILERIPLILGLRIPWLMVFFLSYVLLGMSVASIIAYKPSVRRKAEWYVRRHPPIAFFTLGLILFTGAHTLSGGFHAEYFVPAIASLFPILSIAFVGTYCCLVSTSSDSATHRRPRAWAKALLQVVFVTCLVLVPIRHSATLVDLSGGQLPVEEIREVAQYVAHNMDASDRMVALEALWISIEANRAVLPGLTIAQFSYQDVSKQEAQELKVVNGELILDYIEEGTAKAIIFTDLDLQMFQKSQLSDTIREALLNRYELVMTRQEFGQRAGSLYVFLRDD
ncbi:hypothetical protein ACFLWA_02330 [Chloroflexota bacterium]